MAVDNKIELHAKSCSCGGGSWMLFGWYLRVSLPVGWRRRGNVILTTEEWRRIGKPAHADEYRDSESRAEAGDRREFERFEVALDIKLSRIPAWNVKKTQVEDTRTEVIARGGALVRSRMAIEQGESVLFTVGDDYETKAEVVYVNTGTADGESFLRVGLRFLDEPFPDELIPKDAKAI